MSLVSFFFKARHIDPSLCVSQCPVWNDVRVIAIDTRCTNQRPTTVAATSSPHLIFCGMSKLMMQTWIGSLSLSRPCVPLGFVSYCSLSPQAFFFKDAHWPCYLSFSLCVLRACFQRYSSQSSLFFILSDDVSSSPLAPKQIPNLLSHGFCGHCWYSKRQKNATNNNNNDTVKTTSTRRPWWGGGCVLLLSKQTCTFVIYFVVCVCTAMSVQCAHPISQRKGLVNSERNGPTYV